jgi:hypothetical protein
MGFGSLAVDGSRLFTGDFGNPAANVTLLYEV